jgi:hypothetical protein
MPDYCLYGADWNQLDGVVMLVVKNNDHYGQSVLPNFVNLETIAVCLYLQNNTRLLFVSCYNPPDSPVLHTDLNCVFFLIRTRSSSR